MQNPRRGQRFVLTVRPLDWYAGSVGARAIVEEVSDTAIYVLFDGGLRESFPPTRFDEYFRPEGQVVAGKAVSGGTPAARPAPGDNLHR